MKRMFVFLSLVCITAGAVSCKNKKQIVVDSTTAEAAEEKPDFFPVTNYIKGQLSQIRTNPLKYTTIQGKTDSVWVQKEDFNNVFAEFLSPQIDSATMEPYFKETKFADKTIGTYTFTYEPKKTLPADLSLMRWDVYIDTLSGNVSSIYMEKKKAGKTLQMIWQDNASCKIVYIGNDKKDSPVIEKEELIKWDY
ncbi:MAG: hypothetical protein QM687_05475 [Ferruginibacter sp.]